jgi:predicted DNA-binding protein with PD1-like motif
MWAMTAAFDTALVPLPVRLRPGDDLRRQLEHILEKAGLTAAFVLAGIGSLHTANLRLAGVDAPMTIEGDTEVLTLSGSLSANGGHLHASVSDAEGRVWGGHVGYGCIVRTTAEILVALLPTWRFEREPDPGTGWNELTMVGPDATVHRP